MSETREARTLTQADIQTIIQAGIQAGIQAALAVDRALRPEPPTLGKIDTSHMDQLPGDVSLRDFLNWCRKWNNFCKLEQFSRHTAADQVAALQMVMSPAMLGTMDTFLNIGQETDKTTDAILDAIQNLLRSRRSFYVDREELHDCKQGPHEPFDAFYVRLRALAEAAQIAPISMDTQLVSSIILGIRNGDEDVLHTKLDNLVAATA